MFASRSAASFLAAALPAGVPFGVVTGLAFSDGGYFPPSWGWAAAALLILVGLAVLGRTNVEIESLGRATLACAAAFLVWTALSVLWSASTPSSLLEVERTLVYVAAIAAALVVARGRPVAHVVAGVLLATTIVSIYGLSSYSLSDRVDDPFEDLSLFEPLGYANAFGIFAAMGLLIAALLTPRIGKPVQRVVAGASLAVLAPTLYLTSSRGAWIAAGVGLVGALALDTRRIQLLSGLLVLALFPALGVWFASNSDGVTLAVALVPLVVGAGVVSLVLPDLQSRLLLADPRAARAALVAILALLLAAIVASSHGSREFLALGDRPSYWGAAWSASKAHPVLGFGAGTFQRYWLEHRLVDRSVRDAHSLYLETLAELGPVGFVVLAGMLGLPVAAAIRGRHHNFAPAAFGPYVAYLAHAGLDWDWEMPAVTSAGLFCGAALLLGGRGAGRPRPIVGTMRIACLGVIVGLAVFAVVGLRSNSALAASAEAATRGDWKVAERGARTALAWAPWSSEAWLQLGRIQLAQGDQAAAQASFRSGIARDPDDWRLWLDLALATSGETQRLALAQAARLNPFAVLPQELADR